MCGTGSPQQRPQDIAEHTCRYAPLEASQACTRYATLAAASASDIGCLGGSLIFLSVSSPVTCDVDGVRGMLESLEIVARTPAGLIQRVLATYVRVDHLVYAVQPDPGIRVLCCQQTQGFGNRRIGCCKARQGERPRGGDGGTTTMPSLSVIVNVGSPSSARAWTVSQRCTKASRRPSSSKARRHCGSPRRQGPTGKTTCPSLLTSSR